LIKLITNFKQISTVTYLVII